MKSPFTPNAFFAPEGAPRAPERRRSPKEIILSQYPELNNLKDLPEEQIKARAEAINKLDQYIKDVSRFSRGDAEEGWTSHLKHAVTLDSTFRSIQEQMKTIRILLTKPFDEVNNSEGWDKIIATHLNYIQGDGSANLETISTRMSQRVFLERIVGRNLAGKILVSHQNPETLPTLDKSQIQQKSRLHQLMQVIELQKSGDLNDKVMGNNGKKVTLAAAIRHTSTLLEHNRVQEAVNYFARAIDGKYRGIHVHSVVASNEASADALRALGDTTSAGKVYAETFANNKDLSPESGKTQELYNTLAAELQKVENPANSPYRHRAEVLYHKTINALDPNHPNRLIMEEYREETITSLEGGIILEQTISNFIRSRGSE